jgi:predicted GIY-YIG superfamily endonuclease
MNKYCAYILQCSDNCKYYGHTNDLAKRLKDHGQGRVRFTRNKHPKLVYFKECSTRSEAFKTEMSFKNGKTRRTTIQKLVESFPKSKCQGFNSQTVKDLRLTS